MPTKKPAKTSTKKPTKKSAAETKKKAQEAPAEVARTKKPPSNPFTGAKNPRLDRR